MLSKNGVNQRKKQTNPESYFNILTLLQEFIERVDKSKLEQKIYQ